MIRQSGPRERPVRAACLDVALDLLPRPADRFALGLDRPLYDSVDSAAARLAPDQLLDQPAQVVGILSGRPLLRSP